MCCRPYSTGFLLNLDTLGVSIVCHALIRYGEPANQFEVDEDVGPIHQSSGMVEVADRRSCSAPM